MDNFFLRIKGIASEQVQQRLIKKLKYERDVPFSTFVFFGYSDFDIPLNINFSYLCEYKQGVIEYNFSCKIIMATQGWGAYYDIIPLGHKSVCHVAFDKNSFNLITSKIPIVDTWAQLDSDFRLSTTTCKHFE